MKIKMEVAPGIPEPEIILRCAEAGEAAAGLLSRLYELAAEDTGKLTGQLDGQTYLLDPAKVLYADTADKRAFLYTAGAVYETELRLYELEERLSPHQFVRISNSEIIHLKKVVNFDLSFAGTIYVKLSNGTVTYVSRRYVSKIKKILGI